MSMKPRGTRRTAKPAAKKSTSKVKEPQIEELSLLRRGQALFTYFHFAADRELTEAFLASGAIAIAYALGVDLDVAARGIARTLPEQNRSELRVVGGRCFFIGHVVASRQLTPSFHGMVKGPPSTCSMVTDSIPE